MADDYYQRRRDELAAALENARAARMRELDDALRAVLEHDADVLDEVQHAEPFRQALTAVSDLRRTW